MEYSKTNLDGTSGQTKFVGGSISPRAKDSKSKVEMSAVASENLDDLPDELRDMKAPNQSWLYLAIIVFIGVSNYWQQSIFAYTYSHIEGDPLKAGKPFYELPKAIPELNDFYFSLIGGVEYRLPLAIFSIVAGVLASKYNRKNLLVFTSIIWSVITILEGQSRNVNDF